MSMRPPTAHRHPYPQHHFTHWRGWLKPENRCLVPFNSFAEYAPEPNPETKKKDVVWFALNDNRPLTAFAGIWTEFKGNRGTKSKPIPGPHLVYGFLTTAPHAIIEPIHPKAMPDGAIETSTSGDRNHQGFGDKAFRAFESSQIETGSFRLDDPQRHRFSAFLASRALDPVHEHCLSPESLWNRFAQILCSEGDICLESNACLRSDHQEFLKMKFAQFLPRAGTQSPARGLE
jgi:hypothetical protein